MVIDTRPCMLDVTIKSLEKGRSNMFNGCLQAVLHCHKSKEQTLVPDQVEATGGSIFKGFTSSFRGDADLEAIFVFSNRSRAEKRCELALAELATALWLNNKHRSV